METSSQPTQTPQPNPFNDKLLGMQIGNSNIKTTNTTSTASVQNQVHIEMKMRTKWKSITTVSGLPDNVIDSLVKKWRKTFSCSVTRTDDGIIKLNGDCRVRISDYLIEKGIVGESHIRIHGY